MRAATGQWVKGPGGQRVYRACHAGERGAGTVLVLAVVSVLLAVTLGALVIAAAVVASHRAQSAADLAALAGAGALVDGAPSDAACARAGRVAAVNQADLKACRVVGLTMDVLVTVPAQPWPEPARARARAGPESSTTIVGAPATGSGESP